MLEGPPGFDRDVLDQAPRQHAGGPRSDFMGDVVGVNPNKQVLKGERYRRSLEPKPDRHLESTVRNDWH